MACVASQEVETSAVVRSASVQRGVHGVDCAPQGAQLEQPVAAGPASAATWYKLPTVKGAGGLLPTASLQRLSANCNSLSTVTPLV